MVDPVKVVPGKVLLGNVSVNVIQGESLLSRDFPSSGVGGQPSGAWADTQAVHVIIQISIGDTDGMSHGGQVGIENASIHKANGHNVRSVREDSVEISEELEDIFVELGGRGHVPRCRAVTNIISDKLQEDKEGKVGVLVSSEGISDVGLLKVTVTSVDASVGVVSVHALVVLDHVLVDTVTWKAEGAVRMSRPA